MSLQRILFNRLSRRKTETDMKVTKMNKSVIPEIQSLYGMEEFKALARRLEQIAENRKKLTNAQIQLPCYLFAIAPGCGATTRLNQLSRLLDELHLIRFEGEYKCFEWILDGSAFKTDGGFDRLLTRIRIAAGFHSAFYGVIGLDVDAWIDRTESKEFTRLMDFVEDMMGQILVVFYVNLRNEDRLRPIIQRISHEMPLEVIHIDLPNAEELVQCLTDFLKQRGFIVRATAKEYFMQVMPRLMESKQFDGFQSLDNLADEIVYHYCSGEIEDSVYLTDKDVRFIEEPGGYVERLCSKNNVSHRVGFGGGEY